MVTLIILAIIAVVLFIVSNVIEIREDIRTWGSIRDALKVPIKPGDTIVAKAPDFLYNGTPVGCIFCIHQEHSGLKRFQYRLDIDGRVSVEFLHGDVNDKTDGDVIEFLKEEVYHGRWVPR